MKIYIEIGGKLYCSIDILVECGIKYTAIKDGYRKKRSHWQSIKDPSDRRKRLIAFEPMKDKYKQLVIATHGTPQDWLAAQALEEQQELIEQTDSSLAVSPSVYNFYQKYCNKAKAYTYAKAVAWIELIRTLKGTTCRAWGYEGKDDFLNQLGEYFKEHNSLPISLNSRAMILRQVRKYKRAIQQSEEQALLTVLDSRMALKNARKIGEEQGRLLIALMSRPAKPTVTTVTQLYNAEARQRGWKEIAVRTAELWLNRPKNVSRWYLARHGKKAAYNQLEISTKRDNASAPDVLWVMDGTPVDWYYRTQTKRYNPDKQLWEMKETKWNRLNLFVVLDAYSWKIVGYHISDRENHVAVIESLRAAVRDTMQLPAQIMYDQSSANKKVNAVLKELAKYNTPNKPYRAKGKVLEAAFGHLQQEQLRYQPYWGGQNITAKKLDSRANPQELQRAMRNLPTREELVHQIELTIELWNERATQGRERPNHLYSSKKSKGRAIDFMTFSNLFFVVSKRAYKYQAAGGIQIQLEGQQYNFQTWEQQLHFDLVNGKYQIAYDTDTMDYIYLYQKGKPILDEKGEAIIIPRLEHIPMAIADQDARQAKRVKEYVDAQNKGTQMLEAWSEEADAAAAEYGIQLTPEYVHKGAYNRAEQNLKRQQLLDESEADNWEDKFDNPYS